MRKQPLESNVLTTIHAGPVSTVVDPLPCRLQRTQFLQVAPQFSIANIRYETCAGAIAGVGDRASKLAIRLFSRTLSIAGQLCFQCHVAFIDHCPQLRQLLSCEHVLLLSRFKGEGRRVGRLIQVKLLRRV